MRTKHVLLLGILCIVCIAAASRWGGTFLQRFSATPTPTPVATTTPLADNLIVIDAPLPGQTVTSPLRVRGKARGTWFFEGSFPVVLTDWDGRIIAQVPAQALGEWMTTDWVSFSVDIPFDAQLVSSRATLILQKDNPSGLPEHDDAREITIFLR